MVQWLKVRKSASLELLFCLSHCERVLRKNATALLFGVGQNGKSFCSGRGNEMSLQTNSTPPSHPAKSPVTYTSWKKFRDRPGCKELSKRRQQRAQMQTRLPARLPAPELLSLAHVTSLEQSRGSRGENVKGSGWRLVAWSRGLGQFFFLFLSNLITPLV